MNKNKDILNSKIEEMKKEVQEGERLIKIVRMLYSVNPENPQINDYISEIVNHCEKLTVKARELNIYTKGEKAKITEECEDDSGIPVELCITEGGWFCMRIPMLASKKEKGNNDYIRGALYPILQYYFSEHKFRKLDDCMLIFRHVYKHKTPPSWYRDHDNFETKQVADIVAMFTMVDDGPKYCTSIQGVATGDENKTEIYVVPKDSFPEWYDLAEDVEVNEKLFDFIIRNI